MKRYDAFGRDKLILRDHLAIDRTELANERTFLAYTRTALTLFVAGVTFVHFFESASLTVVGLGFVPAGLATFVVGVLRFRKIKGDIDRLDRHGSDDDDGHAGGHEGT